MKKVVFIFLAVALSVWLFGCKKNDERPLNEKPLRILVDMDIAQTKFASGIQPTFEEFLVRAKGKGLSADMEVEYLPVNGSERETALSRIRTECMAGKGPDVFICVCPDPNAGGSLQALFQMPQKAMQSGLFLPLDKYLESPQYMCMEDTIPAILNAGKWNDKQMILPLTYTFQVSLFDGSSIQTEETVPITWEKAIASGDPLLLAANNQDYFFQFGDVFGALADFQNETLLFTKEELETHTREAVSLRKQGRGEEGGSMPLLTNSAFSTPEHVSCAFGNPNSLFYLRRSYDDGSGLTQNSPAVNLESSENDVVMLPLRNSTGGVTANVTAFAAIGSNTQYPDEAFLLLDVLLSETVQQSAIYVPFTGVPANKKLGQPFSKMVSDFGLWAMSEENYQRYLALLDQIDAVKFYTPLDQILTSMYADCCFEKEDSAVSEIVSQAYDKMLMILAES